MIYLLDREDFYPIMAACGIQNGFEINDKNISSIIRKKLELASKTRELIHSQWLRGIGKTYELIHFAKCNGYAVLHPQANALKDEYKYDFIYKPNVNQLRGISNLEVVIDEGVTNLNELKNAGIKIITGYYTPKEKGELSFKEFITSNLKNEIELLTSKIQKAREREDYGTYKNLILAYKEVLNLLIDLDKIVLK